MLENGEVIPIIVSDFKDDIDTEENNIVTSGNGCVSEFIVDTEKLNQNAKVSGNISKCIKEWDSSTVSIKIYERNLFD